MPLNLIFLNIDVKNKIFVNINGSPASVPVQYDGDKPTFIIYPVQATSSNPQNPTYIPVNLAGYTMNITMADTPNATSPPTPFASLDSIAWDATQLAFIGTIDLTLASVATFIGANAQKTAYINFDVYDATLNRTTFIQTTFIIAASIDAPATGPAGPAVQFLTLAQALGLFVQIAAIPGKQIIWESPDGTKKIQQTLNNDGAMAENPL